ncbi:COG1430 Uncharacterized conserved protein [Acidimicrobiia bacterium]
MKSKASALILVLGLLVGLAACGSSDGSATDDRVDDSGVDKSGSVLPASELVAPEGFRAVTLIVTRPDGTVMYLCVWLADSQELRNRGLMRITDPDLGGKAGMVFRFDTDTTAGFWMKDTLLPLSIAWFDGDGDFVSSTSMEPCPADLKSCPSYPPAGPYRLALETMKGRLTELGLEPGSRVELGDSC